MSLNLLFSLCLSCGSCSHHRQNDNGKEKCHGISALFEGGEFLAVS